MKKNPKFIHIMPKVARIIRKGRATLIMGKSHANIGQNKGYFESGKSHTKLKKKNALLNVFCVFVIIN